MFLIYPAVPGIISTGKTPGEETQKQNTGRQKWSYLKNHSSISYAVYVDSLKLNWTLATGIQTRLCLVPLVNGLSQTSIFFYYSSILRLNQLQCSINERKYASESRSGRLLSRK